MVRPIALRYAVSLLYENPGQVGSYAVEEILLPLTGGDVEANKETYNKVLTLV